MGVVLKLLVFLVAPLLVAVYVFLLEGSGPGSEVPTMVDGWWGRGPSSPYPDTEEQKPPVPFRITTSNITMIDLRLRLHNARIPESIEGTEFEYGLRGDFLRRVVYYWKEDFDWEKQQAKLNALPQFLAKVEGIDVHFVRVEPKRKVEGRKRAIMLIHGWPGSFWEFYKLIPFLMETKKGNKKTEGGEDEEDVTGFEVICPSIPGYGFSEAPHKPGFDGIDAARVFFKLMKKLGHDRFYVHGGDWGGLIATIMAQAYPDHVIEVHVNFAPPPLTSVGVLLRQVVGEIWPSLIYTPAELEIRETLKQNFINLLKETGYLHIQATKPDTVAAGLNDSPAGLAAYILEKFSTWTNAENRKCSDGCITEYFTLDEVLTNVMIYWLSGNIGSSMRFYKEHFSSSEIQQWDSLPVLVPSGIAAFPYELMQHTRSIVELKFHNIVHYTNQPRGGHFGALEEPLLMADSIKSFVRTVERL